MRLGKRAAEHREVLREDVDEPAFDPAPPGDDAVAEHLLVGEAEIRGAMGDEAVELDEAPRIEEDIEPLARRHLPFLMLSGDPISSAALL